MKKPLNKIAILLWALALITLALNLAETWNAAHGMAALHGHSGEVEFGWASVAHYASETLGQFGLLFGLGTLIEIADRAVWHFKKSN